jgi:hypothetical protein
MATELEIRGQLDTMRSLPLRLERLANSIGTTQWPGQPVRLDLSSPLTVQDRTEITALLGQYEAIITGSNLTVNERAKARLSLLTKMLLGMPVAGSTTEAAAEARADMYDEALNDIAPWAINAAIKRWARGTVPTTLNVGTYNYNFAPAPAVLRAICKFELMIFEAHAKKLKRLLQAVSIERAMDPAPIEDEKPEPGTFVAPKLRSV